MANRLVCSTRDSAPLAVWAAAPGSIGPWVRSRSQRVLARMNSAAPTHERSGCSGSPQSSRPARRAPSLSGGSWWALSCSVLACVVAGRWAGGGMAPAPGGPGPSWRAAALGSATAAICRVGVAGCPVVLAVDEHVVGLVGDAGDRGGLRVAGAGRGDAAGRVEAEHLDGVGEQSGGGADLGGVEVQLGDVAGAVGVLGDDLAADRAAVGCLPLRRAGERPHEGVVDVVGEVRVDVVLGEGE